MTSRRSDPDRGGSFPRIPRDEPALPIHCGPIVLAIFLVVALLALLLYMGTR